ncbi:GMC oxidoreductase [Paramyrothecium foliicola]|nr:GMC oxidoreductase [Paramyrothecium foliicola]
MDGLARQYPEAVAAAIEAYGKRLEPFPRSGTNAAARLPMPDINSNEGKQSLEELLQVIDRRQECATRFEKDHADYVRVVL